jgi:hypothetical protein
MSRGAPFEYKMGTGVMMLQRYTDTRRGDPRVYPVPHREPARHLFHSHNTLQAAGPKEEPCGSLPP